MENLVRFFAILFILSAFYGVALAADVNLPPEVSKSLESRVVVSVHIPAWHGKEITTEDHLASGFVVAPGYVLTCSHLFTRYWAVIFAKEGDGQPLIGVGKSLEDRVPAKIKKIDFDNDLVLLELKNHKYEEKLGPPAKIADIFPADGETVYTSGFWQSGSFKITLKAVILGRLESVSYGEDDCYTVRYVAILDRSIIEGFSGGPVFNQNGEVVGMNLFTTGRNVSGILTIEPIKEILKAIK